MRLSWIIFVGVIVIYLGTMLYTFGYGTKWYLNPKKNYEKWTRINLVGVILGTILLFIISFPVILATKIFKLICHLFTVGRKMK